MNILETKMNNTYQVTAMANYLITYKVTATSETEARDKVKSGIKDRSVREVDRKVSAFEVITAWETRKNV